MPRCETVGEVRRYGDRFEWRVDDSHFISQNLDSYISSPPFPFANSVWYFTKRPCGSAVPKAYNWVGLSICGTCSKSPVLNVKLGVKAADGRDLKHSKGKTSPYGCFEEPRYLRTWQFMSKRAEIVLNGYITVFCKLRREEGELVRTVMPMEPSSGDEDSARENVNNITHHYDETDELSLSEEEDPGNAESGIVEKETPKSKSLGKLLQDLKDLLLGEEDSDVTIRVQGKEYRAHKSILRARCPAFHSMFKHEMLEKTTGVVVIDDCDPGTFLDFLRYIYAGTVEDLSTESVFDLYNTADKYCVEELKNECIDFIKTSLSADTFCDAMTLSLQHPEEELMGLAIDFFCQNVGEIIQAEGWERFLHENTEEGNNLLVKALAPEKYENWVISNLQK